MSEKLRKLVYDLKHIKNMFTLIRKQGKYIVGTDLGFGDDLPVEYVMTKDKDGKIIVVSSKIIGKTRDFESETKQNKKTKPNVHSELSETA